MKKGLASWLLASLLLAGLLAAPAAFAAPPPNDNFANAQVIPGQSALGDGALVPGTNVEATAEPGEPSSDSTFGATATVWYRYTAPVSGELSLCNQPQVNPSAGVEAYTGSALTGLTKVDHLGDNHVCHAVDAVKGTTYLIQIDTIPGELGPFELELDLVPPSFPQTKITSVKVKGHKATLRFKTKGYPRSLNFQCKLDNGRYRICHYTKVYNGLDPGKHKFKVRAESSDGPDPTPAVARFKIAP